MRRLRGTGFDPFGRTTVRRVERQLIAEYVEEILGALSPANHQVAVELARRPDVVRCYEQIKLASVARYRDRMVGLRPQLAARP